MAIMTALAADLVVAARALLETCRVAGNPTIATAESCTGGLIAAAITAIPGSSKWYDRSYVVYANKAKIDMLGVSKDLLKTEGAVSEACAIAMAEGVLAKSPVEAAVAVTGIAGPDGGGPGRPVGLVHMAAIRRGKPARHERHVFPGDRDQVRHATAVAALDLLGRTIRE